MAADTCAPYMALFVAIADGFSSFAPPPQATTANYEDLMKIAHPPLWRGRRSAKTPLLAI
ncbi:MAG: hypothetical protein B7X02_01755 [Rhodospirillales bacterium 12-54-5]|nr:MAG: hypothetical protein B7X02_01755 [Rhodospirillales bacterium 12-54-5]